MNEEEQIIDSIEIRRVLNMPREDVKRVIRQTLWRQYRIIMTEAHWKRIEGEWDASEDEGV